MHSVLVRDFVTVACEITYVIILAAKSQMRANVQRDLWLFFQPRCCDNKISLQSKNNIKQSLELMLTAYRDYNFAQECFAYFKSNGQQRFMHGYRQMSTQTKQTNK